VRERLHGYCRRTGLVAPANGLTLVRDRTEEGFATGAIPHAEMAKELLVRRDLCRLSRPMPFPAVRREEEMVSFVARSAGFHAGSVQFQALLGTITGVLIIVILTASVLGWTYRNQGAAQARLAAPRSCANRPGREGHRRVGEPF